MKTTVWGFLILIGLVVTPGGRAFAIDPFEDVDYRDYVVESRPLMGAKVEVVGKDLTIEVAPGVVFTIENKPDAETIKEAMGFKIPDDIKATFGADEAHPEEINPLEGYNDLSPEKKIAFMKRRKTFLTAIARALYFSRGAVGMGGLAKDGFRFLKRKAVGVFKKQEPIEVTEKWDFQKASIASIQRILTAMNYKMWFQAPLVISGNELGIMASVGLLVEQGYRAHGAGGAEELGFSISVNWENKAAVFELFHNSDVFNNSLAAVSTAGIVGKAGAFVRSRNLTKITNMLGGETFYPPGAPGYMSYGPDYYSLGYSSSFGWPIWPFADALTYTNGYKHPGLLVIVISPFIRGFVRIHVGDVRGSGKILAQRSVGLYHTVKDADYKGMPRAVVMRVVDAAKAISDKVRNMGRGNSCSSVLLVQE